VRRGERRELRLLEPGTSETLFGAQMATKTIDEGVAAAVAAHKARDTRLARPSLLRRPRLRTAGPTCK
jgi:hypothetical protein